MKALLLSAYNSLDLVEAPDPVAADDEVVVRIERCGICGSDIHGMDGSSGRRIPPVIMGHEASGTVVSVGSRVVDYAPGDRVTFDSTVYCGRCRYCLSGKWNLCDARMVFGVSCDEYRRDGAFAELVAVPERTLYRIPDGVSFDAAALAEPLSIAAHAVSIAGSVFGLRAAVVGAGVIGTMAVAMLRAAGCGFCAVVDPDETRRERACAIGADVAFVPGGDAPVGEMDLVIEAVGGRSTVGAAVGLAKKGATVVLIGNVTPVVDLHLQKAVTRELRLLGSCGSAGEYDLCLDMLCRGRIGVDEIISAVAPMSEGADWFKRLHRGERGLLKVLLCPHA